MIAFLTTYIWLNQTRIACHTWFLLCLEILCAHWLSGCVTGNPALSLVLLHVVFIVSGNPAFSLGEHPSFPEGGSYIVVPAI